VKFESGEVLEAELLECVSRWDDVGMEFAGQMFIKGLVYGFAYLGEAMSANNKMKSEL